MAEQNKGIPVGAIPFESSIPPTYSASHFALSLTNNELILGVGHSRASMITNPEGAPEAQLLKEWLITLSLSPNSAVVLHETLGAALKKYEELFGQIPKDKNLQVKAGNSGLIK